MLLTMSVGKLVRKELVFVKKHTKTSSHLEFYKTRYVVMLQFLHTILQQLYYAIIPCHKF